GNTRLAAHLIEYAVGAAPNDRAIHATRARGDFRRLSAGVGQTIYRLIRNFLSLRKVDRLAHLPALLTRIRWCAATKVDLVGGLLPMPDHSLDTATTKRRK